jgi:hypothetical protein
MDAIQEVIHTMDANQQKEFVFFIQRNKYRKGRKDLQLFTILKEDAERKPAEMTKLLKTKNLNAYHTIRKRLFSHLADFIILQSTTNDASPTSHVNGMLGVVNYLFDKGLITQGWKYLLLAESLALQHHYHQILNSIYMLQIEKAHLQNRIALGVIIAKQRENQLVVKEEENLQIAASVVREQLENAKKVGLAINFQQLVQTVLDELNINVEVLKTPRIVLDLVKIIRSGIIAKKEFYDFEPFLISNYNRLYAEKREGINPMVKAELVYIIAHTSYRNKRFQQSLDYLHILSETLNDCSLSFKRKFNAKMMQLMSANLVFLNRLQEACENLNELYVLRKKLTTEEYLNTVINLGIYAFFNKEFKRCSELLRELSHSDNWYKKTMGVEWSLKKNLMETILFAELGYVYLVDSRIKSIEKNYASLKTNPIYTKGFDFLKLLKEYIDKYSLNPEGFREKILQGLHFVPYEQEDIQAMAFYAWAKAKATNTDFYTTLLGLKKY